MVQLFQPTNATPNLENKEIFGGNLMVEQRVTMTDEEKEMRQQEMYLYRVVTEYIQAVGIAPNIKGYGYVRQAIINCIYHPDYLESVTKLLYPSVAEKFKTTPSRVERAIRHGIESAWNKGWADPEFMRNEFGSMFSINYKVTNSEFIAAVVDRLHLKGIYFEHITQ